MKTSYSLFFIGFIASSLLLGCQGVSSSETSPVLYGKVGDKPVAAHYHQSSKAQLSAPVNTLKDVHGNALGYRAYPDDARASYQAFEKASRKPIGEKVYWHNVRTGHWGSYCATRDGLSQCGNYCREFVTTTHIQGRVERVYGTACRRPNGTWYLM